jgi:glycine/D-amino acid oxidase-like deaminating enzyme
MALENLSAFDGWTKLITMLKAEKGKYAGYAGMKLVMAMGAAFVVGIAALILILVLLIPIGGLGVISVLLGQAAGLTWNVFTITGAIVAGCVLLLAIFYGVSLISVPVIVFFPAYSIYFFAARYPLLARLIYPPPPPPPVPLVQPPPEPIG